MGSNGNGKEGTLRERFAHNQAAREQALQRLEGLEWEEEEITARDILEAVKVGAAAASGKHAAMSKEQADAISANDRPTPSDPPSQPASSTKRSVLSIVGELVRKFPPWGAVLVALAAIAAYVVLNR